MKDYIALLLIFSSATLFGQKHSLQATLLTYEDIPYSPQSPVGVIKKIPSLFYQYNFLKHLHLSTGIYYVNEYNTNQNPNRSGFSDGRIKVRELQPSIGVKCTPLHKRYLLAPYIESGLTYSHYRVEDRYIYSHWGSTNYYKEVDANGFGFYVRLGLDANMSKKIFIGLNTAVSVNWVNEKIEYIDYIENSKDTYSAKNTIFRSGIELRIGYRF